MKRTALKRTVRVKAKRATKRRSSREHAPWYLALVRELPCVVIAMLPHHADSECDGPTEAHHAGERGFGQKCSDFESHAFCRKHHHAWHGCLGVFAGWSKAMRREFAQAAIEDTAETLKGEL